MHHLATLYSDADQRRLLAQRANERLRRQFTIENYVAGGLPVSSVVIPSVGADYFEEALLSARRLPRAMRRI